MRSKLLSALLLVLAAAEASACSCVVRPLTEMLDEAAVVAVVRIKRVDLNPAWRVPGKVDLDGEPLRMEFDVVEPIRGSLAPETVLTSDFGDGSCGLAAWPGTNVLVVGSPAGDELLLHRCSASSVLGRRSIYDSKHSDMDGRTAAYVAAVRSYVQKGEPIHPCAVPAFPPLSPDDAIAHEKACLDHYRQAGEAEVSNE